MSDDKIIELWLLDGSYKLACEPENAALLKAAGQQLEQRFRDMRSSNPRMDNQKVAVMTALQIMQDLITAHTTLQQHNEAEQQLTQLVTLIDKAQQSFASSTASSTNKE